MMLLSGSDGPERQVHSKPCVLAALPNLSASQRFKTCCIHENRTSRRTQAPSSTRLPQAERSCELAGSLAQRCNGFVVSIMASHV